MALAPATFEMPACQGPAECETAAAAAILEASPAPEASGQHEGQRIGQQHMATPVRKTLKPILKSKGTNMGQLAVPPLRIPHGDAGRAVDGCDSSSRRSSIRFSPHVEQQEFAVTRADPIPLSLRAHQSRKKQPVVTAIRKADGTPVKVSFASLSPRGGSPRIVVKAKATRVGTPRPQRPPEISPEEEEEASKEEKTEAPEETAQSNIPRVVVVHTSPSSSRKGTPRVVARATPVKASSREGTPRVVVHATPRSREGTPRRAVAVARVVPKSREGTPRATIVATPRSETASPESLAKEACSPEETVRELQAEVLPVAETPPEEAAPLEEMPEHASAVEEASEEAAPLEEASVDTNELCHDWGNPEDVYHGSALLDIPEGQEDEDAEDDVMPPPWVDCTELPADLQLELFANLEEGQEEEEMQHAGIATDVDADCLPSQRSDASTEATCGPVENARTSHEDDETSTEVEACEMLHTGLPDRPADAKDKLCSEEVSLYLHLLYERLLHDSASWVEASELPGGDDDIEHSHYRSVFPYLLWLYTAASRKEAAPLIEGKVVSTCSAADLPSSERVGCGEPGDADVMAMVKEQFRSFDTHGGSLISQAQLARLMLEVGWTSAEATDLIAVVEKDADGSIKLPELLQWIFEAEVGTLPSADSSAHLCDNAKRYLHSEGALPSEDDDDRMRAVVTEEFRTFDGSVTSAQLSRVLQELGWTSEDSATLISAVGMDAEGTIRTDEFLEWAFKPCSEHP